MTWCDKNLSDFQVCIAGRAIAQKCPNGLGYNPQKKECDWPSRQMCGARPITEKLTVEGGSGGSGPPAQPCSCPGT